MTLVHARVTKRYGARSSEVVKDGNFLVRRTYGSRCACTLPKPRLQVYPPIVAGRSFRLGLIAEHGYWVKPAAAHRKQQTRDRASTGWDETGSSGRPPSDSFANMGEWGSERSERDGRFGERRGSGVSTPMGQQQQPSMSYKHRGHRRVRTGSGGGLLSPNNSSKQHPTDGAEWIMRSHNADLSWRSEVLAILENFTGRTPGSFLELKDR